MWFPRCNVILLLAPCQVTVTSSTFECGLYSSDLSIVYKYNCLRSLYCEQIWWTTPLLALCSARSHNVIRVFRWTPWNLLIFLRTCMASRNILACLMHSLSASCLHLSSSTIFVRLSTSKPFHDEYDWTYFPMLHIIPSHRSVKDTRGGGEPL